MSRVPGVDGRTLPGTGNSAGTDGQSDRLSTPGTTRGRTFALEDLTLGERVEAARIRIKEAAANLLELSRAYTAEGCATHVAPLRAAHGSLTEALRSFDFAVEHAAHELAAHLERHLGEPKEETTP